MPKPSLHVLLWSEEHQHYELYTSGHLQQRFGPEDEQLWQDWLTNHTSFAFQGQAGHVSVIKEVRPRGSGYWYAYSTRGRQTSKRYLGRTSTLSLTRLEEKALALTSESTPAFNGSLQTKRADPGNSVRRGERGIGWMGGPLWPPAVPLWHPVWGTGMPEPPASRKAEPRGPLLVETRLHHPRLPSTLVTRGRLLQALDTVLEHRLTLLSASAGSGKTTLLSAWAAASSHHVAWLSLDELDNDSTRFWASVIAALRTCLPQIAEVALAMLYSPQSPPLSTILTLLLNEVTACSSELILILDDYHVIEDQAIHDSLIFFLEHLPANLRLVLSSHVDPGLPLSRWRMRGHMAEIRDTDLCFTKEEATSFLTQAMGLSLSEEEVVMLERRTEGWIAGLQLAALAMRKREDLSAFIKTFAGSHRYLLDYVLEEILQRQSISIQHFLLQTAVLSRMNAALCQAVTAEPQLQTSQERLEFLERANLFVVPLDEQRQWYRFHSLFREVLLVRLQASQPELAPLLHQRAARWYEAQGYVHEAMAHALAAKNYSFAAEVLERAVEQLWMNGEAKTVSTWVMALPDTVLGEHIDFALTSALNLLYSTQNMPEQQWAEALAQSEQTIARVEHALQSERNTPLSEADEVRFHNRILLLRGLTEMRAAFREGRMQQVRGIAQRMQPLVVEEQVAWKWIPMYGLFVSAQLLGDSVLLLPELLVLKQQALQEQDRYTAIVVMCWLAAAFLYGGHLRLLQQECLQVQDLLEQLG
ncbi:MAG TPA: LuxR family transcriptional regulator, partial [Ktedonobacteraceae bacterium]|nr:LuxR family transcriptional regulator [Ktedonobacteraceae bacterium]